MECSTLDRKRTGNVLRGRVHHPQRTKRLPSGKEPPRVDRGHESPSRPSVYVLGHSRGCHARSQLGRDYRELSCRFDRTRRSRGRTTTRKHHRRRHDSQVNPDTRSPFHLSAILTWPRLVTVSNPATRVKIAELQGGCRLANSDTIRNTKAVWERTQ